MTRGEAAAIARLARRLEGTRLPPLDMYKARCLHRRVAVRMRACQAASMDEYLACLDHDPSELERLLDALTIGVTSGFRNPEAWLRLDTELPALLATAGSRVTAWSAGCASGEEAWTAALLLVRALERRHRPAVPAILRVDATDVDPAAIARAASGCCAAESFTAAPDGLLESWTEPAGTHRRFRSELRRLVRFEVGDLGRDPPPATGYDLIVCRNVLIYFERAAQVRLLEHFADTLRPGGLLFLGKVESVPEPVRRRFTVVDIRERLFRRAD